MSRDDARGTLYGLGLGPGDPELITVKAREVLARVPVVAYPAPEGGASLVRRIAAPFVPDGRVEIVIATPMSIDRFPAREVYERAAAEIAAHLDEGRDVAALCEGDPFLYGSFMYLYERLASRHHVVVVPGVSSLGAVAAAAGRPLAARNDVFVVLPAPLPEDELAARLADADAAAIMKVGRHLEKVKRTLRRLGLEDRACFVARATMADQVVSPLAEVAADDAPYFSMILTPGLAAARRARPRPAPPAGAAIVALSARGAALARRLQGALPEARVHGLAARVEDADERFEDAVARLRALFAQGRPIVGVCAAGVLIRALAPLLADKRAEPAVVAVAEDGSAAAPLLGGHRGANRLARAIAAELGCVAAITTAGDVALSLALDEPPPGWRVADPAAAKGVAAALLAGEPARLVVEAGDAGWLEASAAGFGAAGRVGVRVTHRAPDVAPGPELVLHPPVLALGLGCERGADAAEALALVESTLAAHGLARGAVAVAASHAVKADEPAIAAVADALGVPLRLFAAEALEAETPRLKNPSDVVFRAVGCHGVAEAAALAAAGPGGRLIVEKSRSARVTCAVALAEGDIDPAAVGRARGRLWIVGVGPGQPAWRTAEAVEAIAASTDLVGYRPYLELIADLAAGKRLHAPPMTEETARARLALDLAGEGRAVALIGSGDAGVYGLATLAFELLDLEGGSRPAWRSIAVAVCPGVSALQAAAARAGAPLGHDFCAISLSDLLTPWPVIERRLQAAADADFVVALYNPVSQRRRSQIVRARDILLGGRGPATPVVLARNLGRPGESVRFAALGDLGPEDADMLTLVLVGSSATRVVERGGGLRLYTPRGYAGKADPAAGAGA